MWNWFHSKVKAAYHTNFREDLHSGQAVSMAGHQMQGTKQQLGDIEDPEMLDNYELLQKQLEESGVRMPKILCVFDIGFI